MYRIVIVDDEPRILEGLVNLFPWNHFGFQVAQTFSNGQEALDYINVHSDVDVVMTDIQMPVMSGVELSQKLLDSDIIVIFFSAYQDFEYARSAILNHVADYLIKPMKYDTMAACIERVRHLLDEQHSVAAAPAAPREDLAGTIKEYIHTHYQTASLEEAAQLTHFSTAYLSTTFKSLSGISFSGYLMKVRMEKALKLLADSNLKLYEIADAVGYANPKNLTRNFKDYYQITPQEFRSGHTPIPPVYEKELP